MKTWVLYAEVKDGQVFTYDVNQKEEAPPREAERSFDGDWATLYEAGKPVKTWMRA